MGKRYAWGVALKTVSLMVNEVVLDAWYPEPKLGQSDPILAKKLQEKLSRLEITDKARSVYRETELVEIDLDSAPLSTADAYLRLHLLSHRLVIPNSINLEGIFQHLPNIVWTSHGPCLAENFEQTRLRLFQEHNQHVEVLSVDKFPRMLDYVVPSGVRIANGATVRLGAYLAEGTTVMPAGSVNFNAGSLGASMIEGRVSQGVIIDEGSDIGGGASTMGTLSGGGRERVRLGKSCLLGANSGLGIPLGDNVIVEAGLYVTAGSKVSILSPDKQVQEVTAARNLAGISEVIFRRNSQNGAIEVIPRGNVEIHLNPDLHKNN